MPVERLSTNSTQIILDLSGGEDDVDASSARIQELLPLLQSLIAADAVIARLTDAELADRNRAVQAQMMLVQATIMTAERQALRLVGIADGSLSIGDYGFPEFVGTEEIEI